MPCTVQQKEMLTAIGEITIKNNNKKKKKMLTAGTQAFRAEDLIVG